jgi:glycosyltransferase involved in cell wall biosynthesis
MKKKSLLYLSLYDPQTPLTGAGTRGAKFIKFLGKHFDIDLIYIEGAGQEPIPEISAKFSSNLSSVRSNKRVKFSQFDYFIFSRKLYQQAATYLKQNPYDFILCDYGLSIIYGLLLSKRFDTPLIYCSHNVEYLAYLDKIKKDKRRLLLLPYIFFFEKQGVKKSKILVTITHNDANHYTRWTTIDKMIVIPQGFDSSLFNPFYESSQNESKVVLFCGNYNIQFNVDAVHIFMKKILEKVLAVFPNTKFRFVGANPPQGIEHPNVEFTGFVEDYPSYLKQSDVFMSPLKQGQGFPTKIIEALACGKKTIATPVGARGIERDYQNLTVCEIEQFPEMINNALKQKEFVNPVDFDTLKTRYSWEYNIQKLVNRINYFSR